MDFCLRQRADGLPMSSLFAAPGFTVECCKFDWLHAADLGVTSDYLGNLFTYLVANKYPGASKQARCTKLFLDISKYYKDNLNDSRLPTLTPLMLQKKAGSPPKLRAKAAEARGLVGFAVQICIAKLDPANVLENTIKETAVRLHNAYQCLSADHWDESTFHANINQFALLFVALEEQTPSPFWRVKPKMHPMLELARLGVNPANHWTYRDEDFGGTMAELAHRRGGRYTPVSVSNAALERFCGQHPLPRV